MIPITVKELIEELKKHDPELKVGFYFDNRVRLIDPERVSRERNTVVLNSFVSHWRD